MNNERARELVENELKELKYVLEWENDVNSTLLYTVNIGSFGTVGMAMGSVFACSAGTSEINGIIAGAVIALPISIGVVHLINKAHDYSKEDKLEMKRDHYSKKILQGYKRQLKKGNNPLEQIPDNYVAFQHKINTDTEIKYAKQLKLK